MMCGGTSEAKPADEEVQALLEKVKNEVQEKLGFSLTKYEVVSYKTQVVAGLNYFAKINLGESIVHVRMYKHFSGDVSLHDLQHPKTLEDEIEYF